MNDWEVRVEMLRFLERVQLQQLAQTRRWIQAAEERVAEIAARRPPPPPPEWVLAHRGEKPATVHEGPRCFNSRSSVASRRPRAITREQAIEALTRGGLEPCPICRPDIALGLL